MMEQHHHRDPLLLHQLSQRVGENGGGTDGGIAGLRVHAEDVPVVMEDLFHRTEESHIGGELPLAQAAQPLHDEGTAVIAVNGGDVVHRMGPGGDGAEVKVHKIHVVAQQDVGRLEALHIDFLDPVVLSQHAQAAQRAKNGGEDLPLPQRRPGGVVALEAAVVDVDALHGNLPPAGPGPADIVISLP